MIDIRPIKAPESFFYGGGWFVIGFVLLALSLLGGWLWLRRRSSPPQPESQAPVSSSRETARRQLEEALPLIHDPASFTVRVSSILREYLELSLALPAPERTTEEFLLEIQSCPRLKSAQRARLEEFLQNCDLVKFAREELPAQELRALHQTALQLIDETQPSPPPVPEAGLSTAARSA